MKYFFLLLAGLTAQINFAQNTFPVPSGNVGIGTTTPNSRLDLGSGYGTNGAKLLIYNDNFTSELSGTKCGFYMDNFRNNNLNLVFPEATNTPGLFTISAKNTSGTILNPYLSVTGINGNVGIGTTNPTQKLEVKGSAIFHGAITSAAETSTGGHLQLLNPSKNSNGIASIWTIFNMTGVYGNSLQFWAYDNVGCAGGLCNNRFTIMDNGNVGIGISNPLNKLDVNGTIHSREVKVDLSGWSDFVFKKEYNLPTLEMVEKHIVDKGHLENIPSEAEVLKNGINLGKMDAKLLQKIEELTLYMIELNKENIKLKNENFSLKEDNSLIKQNQIDLEKRILKIEQTTR